MTTNDSRCTREIKSMIVMAKAALSGRRLFLPANWT
jgi:Ni,Fe-hydrogenase III component G